MKRIFKIGHKNIGTLEDGVFSKEVLLSRHLFRILNAWGVDSSTLRKLPEGTKIELHELEEDKWYTTSKEEFLTRGEVYLHFITVEDYRTQLFLPLKFFKIKEKVSLTEDEQAHQDYKKFL